MKSAVSCEAFE